MTEFRAKVRCEWCGIGTRLTEVHHCFAKGIGGGGRLDIRINVIALGSSPMFQCSCHTLIHAGKIPRVEVLERVAAREKVRPEDIEEVIALLRRLVKPNATELQAGLDSLSDRTRRLAEKELREAGKLT